MKETRLFFRSWKPVDSRGTLVLLHGLGEHSGRYLHTADHFAGRGFELFTFDLRGHGQSGGRRMDAESLDDFLGDIDFFLERVRQEGREPFFLVGHSFGGQLALNYVARRMEGLFFRGLILSSPNIRLTLPVPEFKARASRVLAHLVPVLTLKNGILGDLLSHDRGVVEEYERDPLVQRRISARLGTLMLENQETLFSLAPRIRLPSLFLHGGADRICSPEATGEFFKKIPVEDKTLKIYEGFYHEIFNETEREEVFRDVENWIQKRL